MKFDTLAVHAGAQPDAETGAVTPPMHLSTTFVHAPDGHAPGGFHYIRSGHPTQDRLEQAMAALEGGAHAFAFGSGMAAIAAVLAGLPAGSAVLFPDDVYHGLRTLVQTWFPRWSLTAAYVDQSDIEAVRAAWTAQTRLLWLETPSNPRMKVADIAALATLAHERGAAVGVDNTFATPALQQPLALGADVVVHSATKYLGGHSDVQGGLVIVRDDAALAARVAAFRRDAGAVLSPFNAWLILRGLRTLSCRMERHGRNALAVARFLAGHARVTAVHFPGLPGHPGHALAKRQMRGDSGMLSIEIAGGREDALAVAGRLRLFVNATSLGGCESLVEHRASIEGADAIVPEGLLRLSIGVEDADDLIADLDQALAPR